MPTTTLTNATPAPVKRPAAPAGSRHRYVRPTVQEIRRHGEPVAPHRRAA